MQQSERARRPQEEGDAKRVAALKMLRKGKGLSERHPIDGFPLDLFGVDSWQELCDLLAAAKAMLPSTPPKIAVMSALGTSTGVWRPTLTARRERLANSYDVTIRTVQRWEDEGFSLLAYQMNSIRGPTALASALTSVALLLEYAEKVLQPPMFSPKDIRKAQEHLWRGITIYHGEREKNEIDTDTEY